MKISPPKFHFLRFAAIAILFSLGSAKAQVLIRDDFSSNTPAEPVLTNVAGRHPIEGPTWEGSAQVDGGTGLVADKANPNSTAFSAINVPSDFKKLSVKIRYRLGKLQQLAFGFANSDQGLKKEKGRSNQGLVWVNIGGKRANLIAGKYSSGEKVENLIIPPSSLAHDAVEITLEVENREEGAPFARLTAYEKELAAQTLKPTEQPTFKYFFIQFRGDTEIHSNAIIEYVLVQVE